jgi:hypothetical protein
MLYKQSVIEQLILALEATYKTALNEAKRAHLTATDKANVAENKYDTLGLEAAYLAEGQAKRALQCNADLEKVKKLSAQWLGTGSQSMQDQHNKEGSSNDRVVVGVSVSLIDQHGNILWLFLAPVAGGLKFVCEQHTIMVITPSSPLGKHLLGKYLDDEFEFGQGQHKKHYRVCSIT